MILSIVGGCILGSKGGRGMKIIKEGNLKHPITFNCTRCGCQFIAEDDEYITHDPSLLPITLYDKKYASVICPCCGYLVTEDLD